jgi:hypothetical protein
VPKYRQLIDRVSRAVREGRLRRGDSLPSINELCKANGLSRDTVVKAYNALKEAGVLSAAHGKSFTVATEHITEAVKVFVLFDAFTPYKETLYDAMRTEAGGRLDLDIHFHHFRPDVFAKLIGDAQGRYGYFAVMPFPHREVRRVLRQLDQSRLMLLDIDVDFPDRRCASVLQSHDDGLISALKQASEKITRYESLTLVFPEDRHHPTVIKSAFGRYCRSANVKHRIVASLQNASIKPGHAYFVIEDTDLVTLVKNARRGGMKIGRDIGVLSYNDTPMKELTEPGTSVVSIDFAALGRRAARQMIDGRSPEAIREPTRFISRGSL